MKRILTLLCALMLVLSLSVTMVACGTHECKDNDKNHKCDTCEETMGEHADGSDVDRLCDYGCGQTATTAFNVYVTISNKGTLVMTQETVLAKDKIDDGKINMDEALFAAHDAEYEGGAADGYASYTHEQFGLSLGTLWGDNSGSFGYYLNNASAFGLSDEVKEGDSVYAFVYADATTWSDSYSFFHINRAELLKNGELELTLCCAGYDAEWNPVTLPVEGAAITINGETTAYKTDAQGKVTITFDNTGGFVVSAISTSATLVPPVCLVTVK
ncbi:MAG: hypothetical protein IJD35_02540 [Clostridia bacterium]|nr:hypothetical protein [Clostridia bacterium]